MKWRNCNLGANVPEHAGYYFSWGNTDGHPRGGGYNFSTANYEGTPGASINTDLDLNHDAAHVILGSKARMPSEEDISELRDNCNVQFTYLNDMFGALLTSNVNGNSIFIPASGYYSGLTLTNYGSSGDCWSKTRYDATKAKNLYFNTNLGVRINQTERHIGFTIRPVFDPNL